MKIKYNEDKFKLAVAGGEVDLITQLLEAYYVDLEPSAKAEDSYMAGMGVFLSSSALLSVSTLSKTMSNYIVAPTILNFAVVTIAATVWGVGRLSYEAYHQCTNFENANIDENYRRANQSLSNLESNVVDLESNSRMNQSSLNSLSALEQDIIKEGNKLSPNLLVMNMNFIKATKLREALFETASNRGEIVLASQKLTEDFVQWNQIQKGRETSMGLQMVYKLAVAATPIMITSVAALAIGGPVTTAVAAITAGVTVVSAAKDLLATKWRDKSGEQNNSESMRRS